MGQELDYWQYPESRRLELKEQFPGGDQIAKTVVAFANGAGGRIIFGIRDNPRTVVGVPEAELFRLEERISQCIFDQCYPTIIPEIYIQAIDGKSLLVVEVYPGSDKPYYLKTDGKQNGTYIRIGSTNRKATQETLKELERQRRHLSFDGVPDYDIKLKDLDLTQFMEDYRMATGRVLNNQGLENLGLVIEERNVLYPTNAAILLSNSQIRKQRFPYSKMELARFKGEDTTIFLDQTTIEGPVHSLIEPSLAFIKRNIALGSRIGEVYRKDFWEYPLTALREVLINAVVHRDYSILGSDIKVRIFDNMLEVTSPGSLPDSMLPEALGTGRSEVRNRVLAPLFKDLKLIEAWGTGIKKIREEVAKYKNIQFSFDEIHHACRVQFTKFEAKHKKSKSVKTSSVALRHQKLLDFFERGKQVSFEEVKGHFPKISKRTLQADLAVLKQEGFIKFEGRGRGALWMLC